MAKAPDRLGVQLGYRYWVLGEDGKLRQAKLIFHGAMLWSRPWNMEGEEEARCPMRCAESPSWDCTCGLHGYYELRHAFSESYSTPVVKVRGAALYWGDIIHHKTYFRAEYALPLAFCEPSGAGWRTSRHVLGAMPGEIELAAQRLAEATGVPVGLSREELEAYAIQEAERYGWSREARA